MEPTAGSDRSVERTITEYIEAVFREQGDDVELEAGDDLLMMGFDSIAYIRLIEFIKEAYGLQIPPADVTVEQFGTIGSIAVYLESRGAPAGGDL